MRGAHSPRTATTRSLAMMDGWEGQNAEPDRLWWRASIHDPGGRIGRGGHSIGLHFARLGSLTPGKYPRPRLRRHAPRAPAYGGVGIRRPGNTRACEGMASITRRGSAPSLPDDLADIEAGDIPSRPAGLRQEMADGRAERVPALCRPWGQPYGLRADAGDEHRGVCRDR